MSRPLRIDYPGAWHHVMNRSRRGTDLYLDKEDYMMFLDLVRETSGMYHLDVAAYCLMSNHYHLLVHVPEGNLSRCMRHLNGIYTQKFNVRHKTDGTLFRGRYKSVLVQADSHLLELVRYIHRNPLKAGLCETLDQYKWSSHNGYISRKAEWNWLYKEFILSVFTENEKQQLTRYKTFMGQEVSEEIATFYARKKLSPTLGAEEFLAWVKETFFSEKSDREVPESKGLAPEISIINKVVSEVYCVDDTELFSARRGIENEPRNVAIYLARTIRGDSLKDIGAVFNLSRYSSVSSVLERVKRKLDRDRKFRKRVGGIEARLIKGQT